ncbi:MAG: beta-ketoacyl-ACP synthase I [Verrucomicrobia bacterium]|nr:beta-ketoacyl-ACP synthase I [Kiritimatiellia bacterium]MCP5488498.1 beta-ketoacyl-ACP synthase I [Verrucomicrobiota bacterium]
MKRVVITGMGIVSCIGNTKEEVRRSLYESLSGITPNESYKELGLRSQLSGSLNINPAEFIDRKVYRFMGPTAAYTYIAMDRAIQDAGLTPEEVSTPRSGLVVGTGGGCPSILVEKADLLREKGVRRLGPYVVTSTMTSTVSACLATPFGIKGVNYSICSACATSGHCIGHAMELIQLGKQDIVFAGGADEEHWTAAMMFDAMGALSTRNDSPKTASRPYDKDRDGFVVAGGGGMLVLEDYDRAVKRGAHIYAEVVGYGATSDGSDMVVPSGEGATRCMNMALEMAGNPTVDYINAHGTSTPAGDAKELEAIRTVFGSQVPPITSTKSISGHSLGAASVHEAIYCLLMMEDNFIAPSVNIETIDPAAADMPILQERKDNAKLDVVLSNSFGFGGTNATLIFKKV